MRTHLEESSSVQLYVDLLATDQHTAEFELNKSTAYPHFQLSSVFGLCDSSSLNGWRNGVVSNTLSRVLWWSGCSDSHNIVIPVWGSVGRIWFSLVQGRCSADEQVLQLTPVAMGFPLCYGHCIHMQTYTLSTRHFFNHLSRWLWIGNSLYK